MVLVLEYQSFYKVVNFTVRIALIQKLGVLKVGKRKEFTNETINKILELSDKETVSGLSILGGEPMHPKNIEGTIELAKKFKEKFPKKTIWVWSGFLYDDILKRNPEIFDYIDVMVDGQYVDELHDPTLRWKGSSNQRVIDIKKTQKSGKIVLNTD